MILRDQAARDRGVLEPALPRSQSGLPEERLVGYPSQVLVLAMQVHRQGPLYRFQFAPIISER